MVCPLLSFVREDQREQASAQLMRDRQSQLQGNEPFSLQPYNIRGDNPIGMWGAGGAGGLEAHNLMLCGCGTWSPVLSRPHYPLDLS